MDSKFGWHTAHRVGDLIRVINKTSINMDDVECKIGDLGLIIKTPNETDGILFIEAYMFKSHRVRWFSPREIKIISNIDI